MKQLQYILENDDRYKSMARKLVDIAIYYGFDGWLLNIENTLKVDIEFVYIYIIIQRFKKHS